MYTGIVQARLPVTSLVRHEGLYQFAVELPKTLLANLETGASVSVNGVCFTVTRIDNAAVYFDAISETLALSNIRLIEQGTVVNIERSATANAEIGGHVLSGHVVGTAEVIEVLISENNCRMRFKGKDEWLRFVFEKGFLAINGASLTVAELDRDSGQFAVNLIPETLSRTNFSQMKAGDLVNIEVESQTRIIVETIERIMRERFADGLS